MACEEFRDVMLDVLYGEGGTASARELEVHQQHCASCLDEMRELRALRRDLREWTVPVGAARRRRLVGDAGRWVPLAAALAIGIAGGLAFARSQDRIETLSAALQEQSSRHGAEIAALKASLAKTPFASPLAPASADATIEQLRGLIRESEARQTLVLQASLRGMAERAEAQRREDLAQVSAGFTYLEGRTGLQVARTTELMGHVLQVRRRSDGEMSARPWAGSAIVVAALAGGALSVPPVGAASPATHVSRAELEAVQAAVETAVSRVSRPAGLMFGQPSRAYHLKGYGAVVVLAPRALPRVRHGASRGPGPRTEIDDVLRDLERSIGEVRDPAERRRLRETLAALRDGFPAGRAVLQPPPPRPELAMPPRDIESLQEEAEVFRREAERAMEKAERDVLVRLRVPEGALPVLAPIPPMPPAVEVPPPPPVVVPAPPAPPAPVVAPAPPARAPQRWVFRFDDGLKEGVAPEAILADVRRAIVTGLGGYRGDLAGLEADESVVVAVDFMPRMADRSGARTVVARARKKDLVAHRAGRLSASALRARVEFDEY